MPVMHKDWYLAEAARLRARADEMERIAAEIEVNDSEERYVCVTCGYIGYSAWNCDLCGKHDLLRR